MDDSKQAIETAKKKVKQIRRSGLSAQILGILLTIFTSVIVWQVKSVSNLQLIFVIFTLLGLYFFFSGTYIKDGWGRRVKLALLINGILAFPLCVGIVPIYVCIQSINNYLRFKDLPSNVLGLYAKPKSLKLHKLDTLVLIIVLVASFVSSGFRLDYLHTHSSTSIGSSLNNQPVLVSEPLYSFKIKFPQNPAATNLTVQESGHIVTYTTYTSYANHGSEDFNVYAYSWPAQYFNFDKLSTPDLLKAINNTLTEIVQGRKAIVISTSQSTYLGHLSVEAQFTSPTLGSPVTGYMRIYFIRNNEYVVITLAASQTEFENFANTFQYIGL